MKNNVQTLLQDTESENRRVSLVLLGSMLSMAMISAILTVIS